MPGTNDFKGFALTATDTYTPAEWAALTALLANGFSTGVASTKQVNTLMRQVSSMAAALGKIISDAELNAVDDGDVTTLASRIVGALQTLFAPASGLNRTWQNFLGSRVANTAYQNTSGREIVVAIRADASSGVGRIIEVSSDATTWIPVGATGQADDSEGTCFPVPVNWYYRVNGAVTTFTAWAELR